MEVWTMIFANLVANNLKSIEEVPEHLQESVKQALGKTSELV